MKEGGRHERRKYSRFFLDLPVEFRLLRVPQSFGGIAIDGSEKGLLLYSLLDMPIGTRLDVAVLFPNGCELANFTAVAQIQRKQRAPKGEKGYRYGLTLTQIGERDHVKLRFVLSGLHDLPGADGINGSVSETASSTPDR